MCLTNTNASLKELRDENSRKIESDETAHLRASFAVSDRHGEKFRSYLSTFECLDLTKHPSFVSPSPPVVGASLLTTNKECNKRLAALMPVHLPGFFLGNSQSENACQRQR